MKTKALIISLIVSAAISSSAESWTREHTFQDTFNNLVFDGETFSCFSYSNIAQSSDLGNWSLANNERSFSDVLYLNNEGIYLGILELYTNFTFSIWSMKSTNAINWNSPALIDDPGMLGSLMERDVTISTNGVLLASKSNVSSGMANPYSNHRFFNYNTESNIWNESSSLYIWSSSFDLFSDSEDYYFTYDQFNESSYTEEYETLKSADGSNWVSFCDKKISGAYCHDNIIMHSDAIYSQGGGWQSNNWADFSEFVFNGSRMVAADSSNLLYSDDFGQSWGSTNVGAISLISIIEANGQYVALITDSDWKSHIYTISSTATRPAVSEITGFLATENGLEFNSISNGLYQIECTASLISANWKQYGLPQAGTGTNLAIGFPVNLSSNLFFRIKAKNN